MSHKPYYLNNSEHNLRFDFQSVGKNVVDKSVIFRKTDGLTPGFYSLSLVDVYPDGSFNDLSVSDNGDMEKILVTVLYSLLLFFTTYSEAVVFFEGSTPSRTRLYRIALSHELTQISESYNVWGITLEGPEPFEKNRPYVGFLLSLKGSIIA